MSELNPVLAGLQVTPLCDYWLKQESGGMQRCGADATHYYRTAGGTLFYCAEHTALVRERTRDKCVPSPIRTPDMAGESHHERHERHENR